MTESAKKINKVQNSALVLALGLAMLGLALPLSNLFIARESLSNKSSDGFSTVAKVLQNSCADCHGVGMASYPIYFQFPLAKTVIERDINEAQAVFKFNRAQLRGEESFSAVDLAKIAAAIGDGSMPPMRYKALHWNAAVDGELEKPVLAYIKQKTAALAPGPIPVENPFNPDTKKVALGEKLFFDKRLSADNTVSCASCHSLAKGGADGQPTSTGIHGQKGPINSPTVYNAAFNFCQFWDGRAKDLQEQAAGPLNNPVEMGSSWSQLLSKIGQDPQYVALIQAAYGTPLNAANANGVISGALAEYEKTLLTPNSRFDKYLKGMQGALSGEEQQGYQLFNDKGCASCHAGVALGGLSFEKMGVAKDYFAYRDKELGTRPSAADNGRYNFTKAESDRHKFKVPSLRNIAQTAPYFHDGTVCDLNKAVDIMAEYQKGITLTRAENKAIVAFLNSLTGEYRGRSITLKSL